MKERERRRADRDRELIKGSESRCKKFMARMIRKENIIPPPLMRDGAWRKPLEAIREEHAALRARGFDPETRFDGISIEDRARDVGVRLGGVIEGSAGSDLSARTGVDESLEMDSDSASSVQPITEGSFFVDSVKLVKAALSKGSSVLPVSVSDSCESFKPITRPGTWVPLVREQYQISLNLPLLTFKIYSTVRKWVRTPSKSGGRKVH